MEPAEYQMFIGGEHIPGARTYEVRTPFDGALAGVVHEGTLETLDRAICAAMRAAAAMRELTNGERCELLLRLRAAVQRHSEPLARLVSAEAGKPVKEARIEVDRATETLLAAAVAARELRGETVAMDASRAGKGRLAMTWREPLGVIGAITPWNVPLNLAMHKVATALAAGNSVVHKPSEITPLSAIAFARLAAAEGCPPGAYNVITGEGEEIGQAMVGDPRIRMITFTGSVEVGKAIRANAGLKRVTLELGGNSPVIVEPDADLELAVARTAAGAFANSGQLCISVQRVFVHEQVAGEFLDRLKEAASRLLIGHPFDDATDISSMITEQEAVRICHWIADALEKGATRVLGGERRGATVTPCILAEAPESARISCQEAFGPVVAVNRYRDLDEAIARANSTPYGLQAGVFTRDLSRAFHAARKLEAGGVLINEVPTFRADHMPYGGMKESGLGREGPGYAIEEMTELKLVCWR